MAIIRLISLLKFGLAPRSIRYTITEQDADLRLRSSVVPESVDGETLGLGSHNFRTVCLRGVLTIIFLLVEVILLSGILG